MLLRVGVIQTDTKRRLSARLAVEGISHHQGLLNNFDSHAAKVLLGFGYDLRVHGAQSHNSYFVMGAGAYRTIGNRGDAYPYWMLAPRIGWRGEFERDRVAIGFEASVQYPALTSFGPIGGRTRLMVPVAVTIRH
jgi:hypothetical protein